MGAFRAPGDEDKIRHRVLAVVLHIQEASWRFHGGIAFMTNMLLTKQQIHQARLTEHLTVFDAWRLTNTGRSAWRAKLHLSASTGQRPKAGFRTRLPLDSRPGSDAGVQRHLFPAHRCDARDDPVISVPSGAKDYRWRGATRRVNCAPFKCKRRGCVVRNENLTSAARGEAGTN